MKGPGFKGSFRLGGIDLVMTEALGERVAIPCPIRLPKRWSRRKRSRARARWGRSPKHYRTVHPDRVWSMPDRPGFIFCTPVSYPKLLQKLHMKGGES